MTLIPDTNDIDALLRELAQEAHRYLGETKHSRRHAALTALVAERNALKDRVTLEMSDMWASKFLEKDRIINNLRAELEEQAKCRIRDGIALSDLKQRIAQLEAQEFTLPHEPFRNPDEDLRAQLVCAIWPEIMRQWREYKDAIDPRGDARSDALEEADKMLAAMRKGDECNR